MAGMFSEDGYLNRESEKPIRLSVRLPFFRQFRCR